MKDEIEAFLPLAYNSFCIDSLQFQNHVSKQFLSQASNAAFTRKVYRHVKNDVIF